MPPPPGLVDAKPITEVNDVQKGKTISRCERREGYEKNVGHLLPQVKEEYKMVKKLGSGGFASVFLVANQVFTTFSKHIFGHCPFREGQSILKRIHSDLHVFGVTFWTQVFICLKKILRLWCPISRRMADSMQPSTKRLETMRRSGVQGLKWLFSRRWNLAGGFPYICPFFYIFV